jgi:pimeloyl-ACP methyl ester carboxylesterase
MPNIRFSGDPEKMKEIIIVFIATLFLTACGANVQEPQLVEVTATVTETSTPTLEPTATITPTMAETQIPTTRPTRVKTSTPDVPQEVVRFLTEDEFTIVGSILGDGKVAVILTHMGEAGSDSRNSWIPFARYAAAEGDFTFLAIDFRSYGDSVGERSFSNQKMDILGAIKFLQERGYEKFVCMGASMGGNACIEAALMYPDLIGLAVIASDPRIDRDYSGLLMPKLFVLEEGDPYDLTERLETVYEMMPDPKEYHTFPENVHGTRMFKTESGDAFRALLLDYLDSLVQ